MARTFWLVFVPCVALAACDVSKGKGDDNVMISADSNGQVSFNLPFATGKLKLPQNMFENGHFDIDGVPMMPGATIHGFNMDSAGKGSTIHVGFDAPKSPEEVRSYFADKLRAKGDQVTEQGNSVSGKSKNGDQFQIDVEPSAGGSSGSIQVQSKD